VVIAVSDLDDINVLDIERRGMADMLMKIAAMRDADQI
jgi:hypothetical protein